MVFLILIILVVVNKLIYKSYLNPIFLQSVLWLFYYFFLSLNIDLYDVKLTDVDKLIIYQSIGFSVGGFLCCLFAKKNHIHERSKVDPASIETAYKNILFFYPLFLVVQLISLLLLIRQAPTFTIFSFGDLKDELVNDDGKKFGFFGLVQLLVSVYVIIFITVQNAVRDHWLKFLLILLPFLVFTLLLGSKGLFLFFFCSILYVFIWLKKVKSYHVLLVFLLLIGFMILITFLRWGSNSEAVTQEALTDMLLIYTITSLPALVLLKMPAPPIFGYYTFRIFYVWLNKVGFDFPVAPVLSEFISTPFPTNVYSYVKPYFNDFGFAGVFFLPLILGFVHNTFYFKSNSGKFNYLIFGSLLMYPLGMQIFEENYFRQLTNWVYAFIVLQIITEVDFSRLKKVVPVKVSS